VENVYTGRQAERLSVRPGLTCTWQVSGRSEITFDRWMEMDLEYVDGLSIWRDLVLLARTPLAVLGRRGAM
jgi:lipopolysaccharide/colanic/teichoic acid biosynthesis glycosyltransferase